MTFKVPEEYRVEHPLYGDGDHQNGAFFLCLGMGLYTSVIASSGDGWEHVSVSGRLNKKDFTPSWDIMCLIKDLFWSKEDTVLQYHPPESEYVNFHPNCLHLWRQIGAYQPLPPTYMIGPKLSQSAHAEDIKE